MKAELYKDNANQWRWRVVARNGEVIAQGEAYLRRWNAKRSVAKLFPGIPIVQGDNDPRPIKGSL